MVVFRVHGHAVRTLPMNRKQTFQATQSLILHQQMSSLVKRVLVLLGAHLRTRICVEWLPKSLAYDISDRLIDLIGHQAATSEGEVFGTTPICKDSNRKIDLQFAAPLIIVPSAKAMKTKKTAKP